MTAKIEYTFKEIAGITGGVIIQYASEVQLQHLVIDSRKVSDPFSTIFFAVKSRYRHGMQFIPELYARGVRNFLIDDEISVQSFPEANFILVTNTITALQGLATFHRKKYTIPVIGITGSNGKTIVKEWLDQLLSSYYKIVRSPGSFNSQVGVPLSILQINSSHTLGIFEAGISEAGEMLQLEKMIAPTLGVLTNIGDAHDSGFKSHHHKLEEKCCLFRNAIEIIGKSDDLNYLTNKKFFDNEVKIFTWGLNVKVNLQVIGVLRTDDFSVITLLYKNERFDITIPFHDEASIDNSIICVSVLLAFGIPLENIVQKLKMLHPVAMRLELKQGINNCSIINDSYSADMRALYVAIDFLTQQKQQRKATVILSDILQSARELTELYSEVARLLVKNNINRFIGIGRDISTCKQLFSEVNECYFFDSVQDFVKNISLFSFYNEKILLKGARIFGFEKISSLLELKVHQTSLTINLSAIKHNLRAYKNLLEPETKVMVMVKAFSYGSGSYEIANLLQFEKVDYLAVAFADEGVALRKGGITLPIMVMNPEESTFDTLIKYDLEPEIFSFYLLKKFCIYLKNDQVTLYPIHIKLDTGMHRLGFTEDEIESLATQLSTYDCVKVLSVFSHLIASDDPSKDELSLAQLTIFLKCCSKLELKLPYTFIRHLSNTSAIRRHPEAQMDMVRLGIGLYGIDLTMQKLLRTVGTLTTTIAQIRLVKKGESVGYTGNNILESDALIATVRIGYADGYPRALSNGIGKMLLHGKLYPIEGTVCMDMTMLNITGCINAREGDEVEVYGAQLPVQQLAKWANTITYDIISGISQRVRRVYIDEG